MEKHEAGYTTYYCDKISGCRETVQHRIDTRAGTVEKDVEDAQLGEKSHSCNTSHYQRIDGSLGDHCT